MDPKITATVHGRDFKLLVHGVPESKSLPTVIL